jgi:hypothetical protein|tara:strand:+ start:173 stop:463 length:291 start_codon:yes stop_codon:yes gene_type:complete
MFRVHRSIGLARVTSLIHPVDDGARAPHSVARAASDSPKRALAPKFAHDATARDAPRDDARDVRANAANDDVDGDIGKSDGTARDARGARARGERR